MRQQQEKIKIYRSKFRGRPDVFGRQWTTNTQGGDGKLLRGFSPACDNFYTPGCHIKLKDGTQCASCEIKEYEAVSDKTVWEHISGHQPQIQYMLLEDGTIYFGACDFDCKPGKEDKGYFFKDVRKVTDILDGWKIKHGIARSTGQGYHVYIFFKEPCDAKIFRAMIWELYERAGFVEEHKLQVRVMPEIFPKQASIGIDGGLGNGIKTPMIETSFEKQRNCWVDKDDKFIEDQWEYLEQLGCNHQDQIEALIAAGEISKPDEYEFVSAKKTRSENRSTYQHPISGSVKKIIAGCQAFRRLATKCEKKEHIGHDEGFAMFHTFSACADGKEWFFNNVPGWAQNEKDINQLNHSLGKNYSPWTCKAMQAKGLCVPGTKCLDKKPPMEHLNGQWVVNEDIPETEWADPSPIRFAHGKGEKFLAQLLEEAKLVKEIADVEEKKTRVKELIQEAMVFDEEQQETLKTHLDELGIYKKSQLNKQFSQARKVQENRYEENAAQRRDTVVAGGTLFRRGTNPMGYFVLSRGKGDSESTRHLTDFLIDIEEERAIIEDENNRRTLFIGKFRTATREIPFEIDARKWDSNQEFGAFFCEKCGAEWAIAKSDIDQLKLVVIAASTKDLLGKPARKLTQYYKSQGWYGETYLMPSVLVDKDGVKPNTLTPIEKKLGLAGELDFMLLSDDKFKETMMSIKNDLFNAYPKQLMYNMVAFSLLAGFHTKLNLGFVPVFWLDGTSGHGKTSGCVLLQRFWGNFIGKVLDFDTTGKSSLVYGYDFKDAMLLLDNYKQKSAESQEACKNLIHFAYQPFSVRGALNKDGTQREARQSRTMWLMNGEETPTNDMSVVSRLFLVPYEKPDMSASHDYYQRSVEMSEYYKGVTPRFLSWFLNQDRKEVMAEYGRVVVQLRKLAPKVNTIERLSKSVSIVFVTWKLFVAFMLENGIITNQEALEMVAENWNYCVEILIHMCNRTDEERNINVFVSRLKELLFGKLVRIEGLKGFDDDPRRPAIGFVDSSEGKIQTAYLLPGNCIEEVKKNISSSIVITTTSAAKQLKELGIITKTDKDHYTTVKRHGNGNIRVWNIDLVKLGLVDKVTKLDLIKSDEKPLQVDAIEEGLL